MKAVLLFLGLFTIATFVYGQENLVKDGRFENTLFSANDVSKKFPGKGIWYPYLTSNRLAVITIIKDEQKGNVASMQTLSSVSYLYSFIGQQIVQEPSSGVYTLSFYAKSTSDKPTNVSVYLKTSTKFFPINNFNPEKSPNSSGALKQIMLTKEWVLYSVDFDLSNTISTVSNLNNAGSALVIEKATGADRKNVLVAISSTTKNSGLVFTDISLKSK